MEKNILVIKHVGNEGPGIIEPFFAERGWDLNVVDMSLGDRLPESLDSTAAVVILGGFMNVYEEKEYPFLKEEEPLLLRALVEEVPVLGICLGAQLLAKTCGAPVEKSPEKEIGWYRVKKTTEGKKDSLFRNTSDYLQVFQWHGDTFQIPQGGVLLAEGRTCRNQAFRVGANAYGLQFHVEVTEDMIDDWARTGGESADFEKIGEETKKIREGYNLQAAQIMNNFMGIVESAQRLRKIIKVFIEDGKEAKKRRRLLWWNEKARDLLPG